MKVIPSISSFPLFSFRNTTYVLKTHNFIFSAYTSTLDSRFSNPTSYTVLPLKFLSIFHVFLPFSPLSLLSMPSSSLQDKYTRLLSGLPISALCLIPIFYQVQVIIFKVNSHHVPTSTQKEKQEYMKQKQRLIRQRSKNGQRWNGG